MPQRRPTLPHATSTLLAVVGVLVLLVAGAGALPAGASPAGAAPAEAAIEDGRLSESSSTTRRRRPISARCRSRRAAPPRRRTRAAARPTPWAQTSRCEPALDATRGTSPLRRGPPAPPVSS